MGKLIVCTGSQKNIGTTLGALTISRIMSTALDKPILLADLNIQYPDIYSYLSADDDLTKNIDIVMSYAVSTEDIATVINANAEKLTSTKLEVIMGTYQHENYTDNQYENFIKFATNNKHYESVVLDSDLNTIPDIVLDRADTIILFVNQSKILLKDLIQNHKKLLKDERCIIVVNKYSDGILSLKNISNILNRTVKYKLSYTKSITKRLNDNNINMNDTKYEEDVNNLVDDLLFMYGRKKHQKFALFNNIFFKGHNKEVNENVKLAK